MIYPVEIKNLIKDYKTLRAVGDVSFQVNSGEIFGLLGPNGAGKTTIISTMSTLEKPTSGEVKIFGTDVTKEPKKAKTHMGVVPQEIVQQGFFSVEEILKIYSGFHGILKNQARIDYLIEKLHLKEIRKKTVKQLSGGMKRRLMIAKALVHWPKLLILDEPTAGVDIELRLSLWEFVEELRKSGMSILLTTHYLDEAEKLCDRVGIIHRGKFLRIGITKDLIRDLTVREVRIVLANPIPGISHSCLVRQTDKELQFQIPSKETLGDLLESIAINLSVIEDIQISEGSLEKAFRHIVGAKHA